jgi:hypothetical protein
MTGNNDIFLGNLQNCYFQSMQIETRKKIFSTVSGSFSLLKDIYILLDNECTVQKYDYVYGVGNVFKCVPILF